MEISHFTWSSQTVVLSEREKWLRGRIILNVKSEQYLEVLLDHPPTDFYVSRPTSHIETLKPGCLQVDVGDVESNLFKTRNLAGVTQSPRLKYISC